MHIDVIGNLRAWEYPMYCSDVTAYDLESRREKMGKHKKRGDQRFVLDLVAQIIDVDLAQAGRSISKCRTILI